MNKHLRYLASALTLSLVTVSASAQSKLLPAGVTRVPVTFSGGYDTDPQDRGRPVVLIAGALGVKPEIFREAFSHVHPAGPGSGGPTEAEARQNKSALMNALGKYGITNDRLDTVSNYYRYMRSRDETWTHKDATANALIKNGAIIGYEVTSGGAGYSSAPEVTVTGHPEAKAEVVLAYGKNLKSNGEISALTLPQEKAK